MGGAVGASCPWSEVPSRGSLRGQVEVNRNFSAKLVFKTPQALPFCLDTTVWPRAGAAKGSAAGAEFRRPGHLVHPGRAWMLPGEEGWGDQGVEFVASDCAGRGILHGELPVP